MLRHKTTFYMGKFLTARHLARAHSPLLRGYILPVGSASSIVLQHQARAMWSGFLQVEDFLTTADTDVLDVVNQMQGAYGQVLRAWLQACGSQCVATFLKCSYTLTILLPQAVQRPNETKSRKPLTAAARSPQKQLKFFSIMKAQAATHYRPAPVSRKREPCR